MIVEKYWDEYYWYIFAHNLAYAVFALLLVLDRKLKNVGLEVSSLIMAIILLLREIL